MRKLFTLAAAILASVSMWANPYYIISGKCNVPLTAGMNNAKYQILKVDGETVEATEEISSSITATASLYYNSTSVALADLTTTGNYGTSSSASRTMQSIKLQQNEEMQITLNDKVIEKLDVIYLCGSKDPCSLTIEGEEQSTSDQDVHVYSKSDSFSGTITIKNTSTKSKEYRVFVILTISDAAPSTDPISLVNIEGPTEGYVGKPVTFTLSTDAKATAYQWAVDLVEVEGANEKTFTFTPTEAKEYIITGQARNDYNEEDAWASDGHNFTAIEKPAATPCATLIPAAEGTNPAIGDKIILTEESFGGNIFVADMKAANDIKYNALGLLIGGGGKDSLRVELGHKIAVGTIISLKLAAAGTGNRGLKIQTLGHSTIFDASWSAAAAEELNAFEYEVKAGDKLIGESKFLLARNNSVYLQEVSVSDCGEELAPVTNPVTAVTVAGPETGFVGQTYSFKGTADADADDWIWYVNDIAVDGAKAATFAFTPDAVGTYRIMAGARNGYNPEDGWINSAEVSIVISDALEQVSVSESTVWDWTKAASVNEIKFTDATTPAKNVEVLLANVSGMNNNADFNAQALLFSGEYPVRDGKYCQGSYLKFNTTVAGWVQLDFSNTGGKDGDRPKRYVAVNGVVNTEVGSDTGNKVESARIPVEAGNVEVAGAFEDGTAQYLRIYKLTFSTSDIAEGIENIDASAKAVKIIYNGQLLIKKGDVFYNAQGVVVK